MEKITHDGVDYYFNDAGSAKIAMESGNALCFKMLSVFAVDSQLRILKCRGGVDMMVEAAFEKFSKGDLQ